MARNKQLEFEKNQAELKQRILTAQMNPHFLFNVLNSIQGLIALGEHKLARQNLNRFAQLMRGTLYQSTEDYVTLQSEIKIIDQYIKLEQLCRPDKFEYLITVSDQIDQDSKIPSMIIQPFVENAILHGMRWKETKGLIEVILEPHTNGILCTVKDNGVGRKVAESKKEEKHKEKILSDVELQKEWELFFTDCAYDTENPPLGNVIIVPDELSQACCSDIMDSMTHFILGHEFGHHALEHSLEGTSEKNNDESLNMEFDADLFSCKISAQIAKNTATNNFFLQSNLGAFFALNVLNLIRYSYQIVKNGKVIDPEISSGTHPHIKNRMEKISQFIKTSEYYSGNRATIFALHKTMFDLLNFIWGNTSINLLRLHESGCEPKDRSNKNWLPGV